MPRKNVRERVCWSEKMISDLLTCKRNAQTLVKGENPPVKPNGRRFGYIEYMHKLWTEMGYGHLNLTSQNLSDQARRIECKQTEILSSVSQTVDEQRNIVINTTNLTVNASLTEFTNIPLNDDNSEIPNILLHDVNNEISNTLLNIGTEIPDIQVNDVGSDLLDDEKLNQLVKNACEIYDVISITKGDISLREYTTRFRTTPKNVDISYINCACQGLIRKYDLEKVRETYLKLWRINCIVYSVVNAWIKLNDIKGMECKRKVNSDRKNSRISPACVRVIENEIKSVRSRLSKCHAELARLKANKRMTRRTKRNRAEMEKECGVITHYSLVCYIHKLKKRLKYLAKKRTRKIRSEKSRKLNAEFQRDQKGVFDKFRACIEEDPENLKPVYKEKVVEKKHFEDASIVETFWRKLWEKQDSGNPDAPWLKEIEEKFESIVPEVYEGDLDVTIEVCWETIRKKKNWSAPGPDQIANFWWKKLKCIIGFVATVFRSICNIILTIERWVCTGRVSLLPKPGEWSESNQRPITCLNTLYKWITSVLRYFHNDHLKKYGLAQIDQRGVKQKSSGTMCNLLVDDMVLRDARLYHRNLFCYWVDVRKAFDSVSHSWLTKMLKIHRFPAKLVALFTNIMDNWSVRINIPVKDGFVQSAEIRIVNGILQGDSYCPDLYVLSINVQSWTIRTSEGYMLHAPISEKVTHTLYIDDLKGYTNTLRKLSCMLNLVRERMEDAGLIWNPKKCKFMVMKRGKFTTVDHITLTDGSVIKCLKPDENYEFMGIPQRLKMDDITLAQDLLKTVKQRSHIIWSSGLSDINKVKASNTFVNSSVEYYFWAVKFTLDTIRAMDLAVRDNMNMTGSKPTHLMNVVNYLPRAKGGRGLRSMEASYKATKIKLATKLLDEDDQRVTLVKKFHLARKDSASFSIFKDAERYAAELDLEVKFTESEVKVVDMVNNESIEGSLIRSIKSKTFEKNFSELLNSTWQGVNVKQRIQDENVKTCYFNWLQKWTTCPTEVVHEFILFFYQLLPTLQYKRERSNETIEDVRCRICHQGNESTKHLISNCDTFAKTLYFSRHDNALKCFVWPLLCKFNLSQKCPSWYANDKVAPHYSQDDIEFWWDVPEYTGRDEESDNPPRPDAKFIIDKEDDKRVYLIEMTVPWTENRKVKYEYKSTKYEQILQALQFEYQNHVVDQITVVMDVFGGYGQDLEDNIGKIFKDKEDVRSIIKNMQKSVISSIVNISRTFKIRSGLNTK